MTAKAALAKALLDGNVLNVKNCFTIIGLTNCAREISRMIEQPFGVIVSRTQMEGKSRYGQPVTWYNYRLNSSDHNKEGIKKMREYVAENWTMPTKSTTVKESLDKYVSQSLFT